MVVAGGSVHAVAIVASSNGIQVLCALCVIIIRLKV
jgi:hypothetical protein